MKFLVLFCEGPHDIAFVARLLKTKPLSLKGYGKKINKMPALLSRILSRAVSAFNYEDTNLDNLRPPLPARIMKKDDLFVLFYKLDGIDNLEPAKKIVTDFYSLVANDDGDAAMFTDGNKKPSVSFLSIADADDIGIGKRVETINKIFAPLDLGKITHNRILRNRGIAVGCYVFAADDGTGKLEDIILPLMEKGNQSIFDDARDYIKKNRENVGGKNKIDPDKSTIGIAGKLELSVVSNSVIIKKTAYLNEEKLTAKDCRSCFELIELFKELL